MALLTESALRDRLRDKNLDALREYRVEPGTIVTPAARAYLSDHKIELVVGEKAAPANKPAPQTQEEVGNGNLPVFEPPRRYRSAAGAYYDEKPEHMTALRGTTLVPKDHPAIRLRGRLDSLDARMLEVEVTLQKAGRADVVRDLEEVRAHIHEILRCEVMDQPLEEAPLLGMTADEIRERSHTPRKYYGRSHFLPGLEHGEAVAMLNGLRTQVREVELEAYTAFRDEYGSPARTDLLRGLNRLSSLLYVMMFRALVEDSKQ